MFRRLRAALDKEAHILTSHHMFRKNVHNRLASCHPKCSRFGRDAINDHADHTLTIWLPCRRSWMRLCQGRAMVG